MNTCNISVIVFMFMCSVLCEVIDAIKCIITINYNATWILTSQYRCGNFGLDGLIYVSLFKIHYEVVILWLCGIALKIMCTLI